MAFGNIGGGNVGTIAGTVIGGPVGTIAGAGVDGKFNNAFEGTRNKFEKATGVDMPGVSGIDMSEIQKMLSQKLKGDFHSQQSAFRGDQNAFVNALQQQMAGKGPSLASLQAQQQGQQGLNQILALQASQRGVNPAMAARNSQQQAANLNAQIAQTSAMGRAQEQLNAQSLLGNSLTQFRGQDQARSQFNTNMNFQTALANQQGQANAAQAMLEEALQKRALVTNKDIEEAKIRKGFYEGQINQQHETGRSILGGMGSFMAMSDARHKFDIESVTKEDVIEFVNAVKPSTYKYNDPDTPHTKPGTRVGLMLQDVADTKLGKLMIVEQPDGTLMYDRDNFNGVILAIAKTVLNEVA